MIKECVTYPGWKYKKNFSPVMKICDFIWVSGQLPIDPDTDLVVGDDIQTQTEQCIKNICTLLDECGLTLCHVLQVTVYLTDMAELDGFEEIYAKYFKEPFPARTIIQVGGLQVGSKVQIDCSIMDSRALEILMAQEEDEDCCECCK